MVIKMPRNVAAHGHGPFKFNNQIDVGSLFKENKSNFKLLNRKFETTSIGVSRKNDMSIY